MNSNRTIHFTLNGHKVAADISVQENVVEMLQRVFCLFGARESCGQGLCGCCTVIVNGNAVSGCLYLAALVDGANILTIEGLSRGGGLGRIQQAFIDKAGFQCGFCTPGMILTAKELLDTDSHPTDEQIRHHLSGNLCRCCTYPEIVEAVKAASTGN